MRPKNTKGKLGRKQASMGSHKQSEDIFQGKQRSTLTKCRQARLIR